MPDDKNIDEPKISASYKELLSELKKYNEESTLNIYIPSLSQEIQFKPLTVKQQTDIITSVMTAQRDENIYAYQNIIDTIILDNCDQSQSNDITSGDRACILIQLRLDTMGDTLEIQGETYDLKDHVASFPGNTLDYSDVDEVVVYEGITVTCHVPTLRDEAAINKHVHNIFKKKETHSAVCEIFLIELAKHIDEVQFDGNIIEFSALSLKQKIQICEMLPMAASQQVVEYIESVREKENVFTSIKSADGLIPIPIDSQLFNK